MMKHREISLSNTESDVCSQISCSNPVKRSIPRKRAEKSDALNLLGTGRKVGLCADCHRLFKKSTKKDRAMESLGR